MTDTTARYDFKPFKQGVDWTRVIEFKTAGVATPLTDYHARMTIRDEPSISGAELLSINDVTHTANGSLITIVAATGLVSLFISDEDTDSFTWTKAYYDLKLIDASAKESVPLYGELRVIPKVTV